MAGQITPSSRVAFPPAPPQGTRCLRYCTRTLANELRQHLQPQRENHHEEHSTSQLAGRFVHRIRHHKPQQRGSWAVASELGESHRGSKGQHEPRRTDRSSTRCLLLNGAFKHSCRFRQRPREPRHDRGINVREDGCRLSTHEDAPHGRGHGARHVC
jgi:hypothetical protein